MLRGQNNLDTGGAQTSDFTNKSRDYNYKLRYLSRKILLGQ